MQADPRLDPDAIRRAVFATSFRGYDTREVDQFLASLVDEVEASNGTLDRLQAELAAAEARAAEAAPQAAPVPTRSLLDAPDLSTLDDDQLAALIGEETTRVLATARRASEEIRTKAEESAARMIREATDEAATIRAEAEADAAMWRDEAGSARETAFARAEDEAAEKRASLEATIASRRAELEAELAAEQAAKLAQLEDARQEAAKTIAEAQEQGKAMLAEARDARQRILDDLSERREVGRHHIQLLVDGRDRLLHAIHSMRADLDRIDETMREAGPAPRVDELASPPSSVEAERSAEVPDLGQPSGPTTDDSPASVSEVSEPVGDIERSAATDETVEAAVIDDARVSTGAETEARDDTTAQTTDRAAADPAGENLHLHDTDESGSDDAARADASGADETARVDESGDDADDADRAEDADQRAEPVQEAEPAVGPVVARASVIRHTERPRPAVETIRTGLTARSRPAPERGFSEGSSAFRVLGPVETPTPARSDEPAEPDSGEGDPAASASDAPEPALEPAPVVRDLSVADDVEDAASEPDPEPEPAADADADTDADLDPERSELASVGTGGEVIDLTKGDDPAPPVAEVDDLFARIRREREAAVADANVVLAKTEPAGTEVTAEERVRQERGARSVDVDEIPHHLLATEEMIDTRAAALAPIEKSLGKALRRVLADEQNRVLDALRQTGEVSVTALFGDEASQADAFAQAAQPALSTAATIGAAGLDPTVEADVTPLAERLSLVIVAPFRERIERIAADVGDDVDAFDDRLRACYREWKTKHLGISAADALLSAHALGQFEAAPDSARLRWLIAPDQGPCPDAQDNALAGPTSRGELFPTGDRCPQAHPGCRCVLVVDL